MLVEKRRKHQRIWLVILGCILVVVAAATLVVFWAGSTSAPANIRHSSVAVKKIDPKQVSSNVLFFGNTFWGRYINDWSMASKLKYAYPFSQLNEFNRSQYNAWISGLECPMVPGLNINSTEMDQTLTFNCSPNYLPEAAKWFTAFTLANNHTADQGPAGFTDTQQELGKYGIQYFGNPDPTVTADVCEVIGLPVTILNTDNSKTDGKLPVAMCGFHGVFQIPPLSSVAVMAKYAKYMPVIAMPHMGTEYVAAPDELKTTFYRSLIDGGADMVLGDHPHWIQPSESYKGHLIVYSMGNFIFDQQDTPEVVRSAGIRVVMTTSDNSALLQKWLTLGAQCSSYKDDCLAQAEKQNLQKLDIKYQFGVVGTNDSDKITKPADAVQQAGILQRLNWQSTMNGLQAPYSSM
jgi:poly-gamma-glutamate synthesis protein (capsule biosynthesis protein)